MVCTNFLDLLTAVMTRPAGTSAAPTAPRGSTRGNRVDIPLPLKRRLMIIGVPEVTTVMRDRCASASTSATVRLSML